MSAFIAVSKQFNQTLDREVAANQIAATSYANLIAQMSRNEFTHGVSHKIIDGVHRFRLSGARVWAIKSNEPDSGRSVWVLWKLFAQHEDNEVDYQQRQLANNYWRMHGEKILGLSASTSARAASKATFLVEDMFSIESASDSHCADSGGGAKGVEVAAAAVPSRSVVDVEFYKNRLIYLDAHQQGCVGGAIAHLRSESKRSICVLAGSPGSGKTIGAKTIIEKLATAGSSPIYYLAQAHRLRAGLMRELEQSPAISAKSRESVYSLDYLMLLRRATVLPASVEVVGDETLDEYFAASKIDISLKLFKQECEVMAAEKNFASYCKLGANDSIFYQKDRAFKRSLWEHYIGFQDSLGDRFHPKFSKPTIKKTHSGTAGLNDKFKGVLIVDEALDLSRVQIQVLIQLGYKVMFMGDYHQDLKHASDNLRYIEEESSRFLKSRNLAVKHALQVSKLTHSYRLSAAVADAANNVLAKLKSKLVPHGSPLSDKRVETASDELGCTQVFAKGCGSREINALCNSVRTAVIYNPQNTTAEDVAVHTGSALCFTIDEIKGSEFDNIVLWNFITVESAKRFNELRKRTGTVRAALTAEDRELVDEVNELFTAITRAHLQVVFKYTSAHPELLEFYQWLGSPPPTAVARSAAEKSLPKVAAGGGAKAEVQVDSEAEKALAQALMLDLIRDGQVKKAENLASGHGFDFESAQRQVKNERDIEAKRLGLRSEKFSMASDCEDALAGGGGCAASADLTELSRPAGVSAADAASEPKKKKKKKKRKKKRKKKKAVGAAAAPVAPAAPAAEDAFSANDALLKPIDLETMDVLLASQFTNLGLGHVLGILLCDVSEEFKDAMGQYNLNKHVKLLINLLSADRNPDVVGADMRALVKGCTFKSVFVKIMAGSQVGRQLIEEKMLPSLFTLVRASLKLKEFVFARLIPMYLKHLDKIQLLSNVANNRDSLDCVFTFSDDFRRMLYKAVFEELKQTIGKGGAANSSDDDCARIAKILSLPTVDINNSEMNPGGYDLLGFAAEVGNATAARVLLECGAERRIYPEGKVDALDVAVREGHAGVVEELLKSRIFTTAVGPSDQIPLHVAVFWQNSDVVRVLLRHKASVESVDKTGYTPFLIACSRASIDIINQLIRAGADIRAINPLDGCGSFDAAAVAGSQPVADRLIELGVTPVVSVNAQKVHLFFEIVRGNTTFVNYCADTPGMSIGVEYARKVMQDHPGAVIRRFEMMSMVNCANGIVSLTAIQVASIMDNKPMLNLLERKRSERAAAAIANGPSLFDTSEVHQAVRQHLDETNDESDDDLDDDAASPNFGGGGAAR